LYWANEEIKRINIQSVMSVPSHFIHNYSNDQSLLTLSHVIHDSTNLLKEVIDTNDINSELRIGLKELFSKNLSGIIQIYCENCKRTSEQYLSNKKAQNHDHGRCIASSNNLISAANQIESALQFLNAT
jgi:hypothetical protein